MPSAHLYTFLQSKPVKSISDVSCSKHLGNGHLKLVRSTLRLCRNVWGSLPIGLCPGWCCRCPALWITYWGLEEWLYLGITCKTLKINDTWVPVPRHTDLISLKYSLSMNLFKFPQMILTPKLRKCSYQNYNGTN